MKKIKEVFNNIIKIEAHITDDGIISVDQCKPNSLVIFAVFILDKQVRIK